MDQLKAQISEYLELPISERLLTPLPDLRQIDKSLRDYTQGLKETPYLTRVLGHVMDPNHKPSISEDIQPREPSEYQRDWRKLMPDLVAAHAPEAYQLGHGWAAPPAESVILDGFDSGDLRDGFLHWSALREQKVVIRLRGPWQSVDHGYRILVVDFSTGELSFIKREFAALNHDALRVTPDELPQPSLTNTPSIEAASGEDNDLNDDDDDDDEEDDGLIYSRDVQRLEAEVASSIFFPNGSPAPHNPYPAELIAQVQENTLFLQSHPDLFNGHFYPPNGIEKIPGCQLTPAEREFLFVSSPPAHLKVSYQLSPRQIALLNRFPQVRYSDQEPLELQAKKLRQVLPLAEFLQIPVSITDLSTATPTTTVYSQQDLAVADVEEEERVVQLSPAWLNALKSVFWPKSMVGISSAVYSPYITPHMQLHQMKPSETSPMTDVDDGVIPHVPNATPYDQIMEALRDVPDLATVDPEIAKQLDLVINTPGLDLPPIGLNQRELSPFDIDSLNDNPLDPITSRWRFYDRN